jgi:hypothetical protein
VVLSRSGLCFFSFGVFACLPGLARFLVSGLYEIIQYIISLNKHGSIFLRNVFAQYSHAAS